jgi:DNA-binding transcriptional LysR family regulator
VSIDPSLRLAPSVLKDFRLAFPSTTIHLTQRSTSELFNSIRDNRLDLAVARLPESFESGDLTVHHLYEAAATIVARKGHPLSQARSVSDLASSEWIVVGDPAKPGQQDESIQELFLRHKLGGPRFAAVSDSLFDAISMLLESDCVARLPALILRHPLAVANLTEIKIKEQLDLAYQVGIVFKAGRRLGREATQLVSMLKSFARLSRAIEPRGS